MLEPIKALGLAAALIWLCAALGTLLVGIPIAWAWDGFRRHLNAQAEADIADLESMAELFNVGDIINQKAALEPEEGA